MEHTMDYIMEPTMEYIMERIMEHSCSVEHNLGNTALISDNATKGVIKDVTNETPAAEGTCFYNGTWYDEGTELPTRGLCLICHCFQGFTEPNAFTCSVIDCPWEDYHKRFPGCTPIYADRDCCPIGWECDQRVSKDPECDCEWRYLKHYEAKGCRPVYEEKKPWRENRSKGKPKECPCPWRFDCSITDDDSIEERACIYKKQIYPIGTKINTTNPCESCSCVADYFTQAPTISCLTVECPTVYSKTPLPEGCHYVYTEGQCCPIAAECPTVQEKNLYNVPICEYKGKMYYEGEQIYPDEDPCLICLCTPQWTGVNSTSCRQHDCMLERDARKLKQGCIPIYHEKTCCPIDYHCADEDFGFPRHPNRGPSFKSEDDEDEMCSFEGRYYPIGHVLDIKHPTNCVTCTCKTPPDFTCIHSSCPPPPNNDYTNCKAVYKPHSCCPDYACEQKSNRVCPDPICHGTNCWLVKREEDGCSICRCKSRCMPCPDMCQPENPDNECSGCICQINSTALISMEESGTEIKDSEADEPMGKCSKVKCLSNEKCMLTKENCEGQECELKATCEKIVLGCVREVCPSDCEEIGRYEESCPICHCKDKTKGQDYEVKCKNPICESSCIFEGKDENDCPICKCPSDSNDNKSCPLTKCRGYNCSLAINDVGCIDCTCQLPCKPRECPSGCDLDLDAIDGDGLMCGCRCKNASAALDLIYSKPVEEKCPEVTCRGYNCTVSSDDSSCPTCICKDVCEIPKCLAGCRLENDTTDGRCPACVCKLSRSARDNTQKECPPPTCLGYNCSVITGEDGCQQCLCESPCEEQPQCPSHCKLESTAPEGRCRACICSENTEKGEEKLETSTSPSKPTNYGIPGESVEPEKRENWDADFIPLPNKDIVPEVDNIYLLKDKNKEAEHVGDIHAYPVFGEKLESGFYMAEDSLIDPSSDNESKFEESSELKGFGEDYMEEKGFDDDEKCLFKNCPPGQKCMTRRLQCIRNPCPTIPVCIDVEPRCPIPSCAIGCMVMKWDDEVCPSCFCGIIRGAQGKVCPRVPCAGERCYNVIGDDGCPKCKCDSICIPPECPDGCWLETESSDGQCPKCSCPRRRTTTISPSSFGSSTTTERPMSTTSQTSSTTQSSTPEEESKTDLSSLKESSTLPQEDDVDSRSAPSSTVTAEETTIPTTTVETTTDTIPSTTLTKQKSQPPTSTLQDTPEHINTHMPDDERTTVTVSLPIKTEVVPITDKSETQESNPGQNIDDSVTDLPSLGSDSGFPEFPHSAGSATTRQPSFIRKPPQTPPRLRKPSPHITGVRTTTVSATDYGVKKFSSNPLESSFACPTPHCNGYNCSLLRGSDGCQKCVCDSPCSPCPQHCVKTKTLADGRCPICDCTGPGPQKPIVFGTERCSPVECRGQNCRQVKDSSGCPTCVCDPQCVIPKCDPGCEILTDVPAGQCPGCVCKVTVVQAVVQKRPCPIVSCSSPNCKEVRDENGCAKCECGPACPPPKCDPGCSVQTDVAAGQCPTCVCSEYLEDDDDEEDEAYCPNLFCADYGCREIPGPAGCPICLCDPLCKTPVCEPGCEIVTNKYLGRCPVCICRSPNEAVSPSKNISKFGSEISSDQEPIMLQEEIPKYTTVSLDMQEEQKYHPQKYQPQQQQQHQQQDQHQYQHDQLELSGQHMLAEETTTEEPTTTTTPKPTCPSPLCSGLRCQTTTDSNGCAVCKCKYPCPTPKCVGNCYAETNYPSHRCPGCVCPSRRKPPAY